MVVVLPAPFGPRYPRMEPSATSRSSGASASTEPKCLVRHSISIAVANQASLSDGICAQLPGAGVRVAACADLDGGTGVAACTVVGGATGFAGCTGSICPQTGLVGFP